MNCLCTFLSNRSTNCCTNTIVRSVCWGICFSMLNIAQQEIKYVFKFFLWKKKVTSLIILYFVPLIIGTQLVWRSKKQSKGVNRLISYLNRGLKREISLSRSLSTFLSTQPRLSHSYMHPWLGGEGGRETLYARVMVWGGGFCHGQRARVYLKHNSKSKASPFFLRLGNARYSITVNRPCGSRSWVRLLHTSRSLTSCSHKIKNRFW